MEIQQASLAGLVKTVLIIIGAVVALRFIGRLMIAKRNLDEERQMLDRERQFQRERNDKLKNYGRVSVSGKSRKGAAVDAEDAEYEEIN